MIMRSPHDVAKELIEEAPSTDWLRALADDLDRRLRAAPLDQWLALWGLSDAEAARAFGVSRQAIGKWRRGGVPPGRAPALADLAAATDILDRKVKRERIPAVVRRAAPSLDGRSLYELACAGEHARVLEAVRHTFDLRRIQP
jgi:transcriptional regulator with XRE-family HTH domain